MHACTYRTFEGAIFIAQTWSNTVNFMWFSLTVVVIAYVTQTYRCTHIHRYRNMLLLFSC